MSTRPSTRLVFVFWGLMASSLVHASQMPDPFSGPAEFWGWSIWFFLSITHWLWFRPLAALPIALITPGLRPITDPPSRRWPDVFSCMAISYLSFIPLEFIMVGLFTGEVAPWTVASAPFLPNSPRAIVLALTVTLFVFAVVQAGMGMLMKHRRLRHQP